MPKEIVFLLPFIAAGIGWITNYLAVKMLFHPRKVITLAGIRVQGVFPKRQEALAERLGDIVSDELFSIKEVTKKIHVLTESEDIVKALANRIEKTISGKLLQNFPMLSMFLTDEMVGKVSGIFLAELKDMLGDISQVIAEKLEDEIDVRATVREKVKDFSSDKLEEILFSIMKKEFRFIEYGGAVLGFLIGSFQLLLTWPY